MGLDRRDLDCLKATADACGGWRPWRGVYGRAKRLAREGYLLEAGFAAMPPHVVYVLGGPGHTALAEHKAREVV